ncbi:MAG TPA: peroxide stress protein YaaA [Catenuloplanes sp.]
MLILLPPSEGKAASGQGRPLDLAALSLPTLRPARERVLEALVGLCAGPDPQHARTVLGLPPGLQAEVLRNAGLRGAPTAPAAQVYTGVLYASLDLAGLPPAARRRVRHWTLVFSALWGVARLDDPIAPYRCSMAVRLPGVGSLTGHWRAALPAAMAEAAGSGPVLDLRSGGYAGAWTPPAALAGRTATVRVLHERIVDGLPRRSVVSHFNKAVKGRLVRSLALAGAQPRSLTQLVRTLRELGYLVVDREPAAAGRPRQLDVVVHDLSGELPSPTQP